VFQSLPIFAPNPEAYPIDNSPYGAVTAYPNLGSRKRLANELDWAKAQGLRGTELAEGMSADAVRKLAEQFAGQDCLYVVTVDGRMFLIPSEFNGEATTHAMAAGGVDVIAAGHVLFDSTGKILRWDHLSGHYRPGERQSWEVAHAIFTLTGLHPSG
jgi:hypothetical protein